MKPKTQENRFAFTSILIGIIVVLLMLNFTVLYFLQIQSKRIITLRNEYILLVKANEIMQNSATDYSRYLNQADKLKQVFPSEESIPDFISLLEEIIRESVSEYSFRFASLTPLAEKDKLYLILNLTVKTDFNRLLKLLSDIESIPYMSHVLSISAKSSQGFSGESEIVISLKVYVQKPFATK